MDFGRKPFSLQLRDYSLIGLNGASLEPKMEMKTQTAEWYSWIRTKEAHRAKGKG